MLKKLLTLTICLLFLSSVANAWLAGYGYRKKITIQGANLDANVTHFPLLIYIVDGDIDDHCDDDGDRSFDIRFTQSDDSVLDVNWEDYSEAGGNATIWAWVSDAGWTIESDGSTEIYLYYGNAAAGDPATDAGVWDADFMGVWHLREAAGNAIDSAGDNDGTFVDDLPTQTTAKIYYGQTFDGTSDWIDCGQDASVLPAVYTLSAWIKTTDTSFNSVVGWRPADSFPVCSVGWVDTRAILIKGNQNHNYYNNAPTDLQDDGWHWVSFVVTGDAQDDIDNDVLYVDANTQTINATVKTGTPAAKTDFRIGHGTGGVNVFNGIMDEVRLSDVNRSVTWMKFEYYNMNEGDNELTWAGEEEAPADGFVPKVIIIR